MLELIPKQKIEEAAHKYSCGDGLEPTFYAGVDFTLKEVEPFIIEFADWMSTKYTCMDGMFCLIGNNNVEHWIDSKQLLQQFIEERNK